MAEDRALLKYLKEEREKKKKTKPPPVSMVCIHLITSPEPQVPFYTKDRSVNERDTGRRFLCQQCARRIDTRQLTKEDVNDYIVMPEKEFRMKIKNYERY